jgi:hypothetical protein
MTLIPLTTGLVANRTDLVVGGSVVAVRRRLDRRNGRIRFCLHVAEAVVSVRLNRSLGGRLFEPLDSVVKIVVGTDGDDIAVAIVGVGAGVPRNSAQRVRCKPFRLYGRLRLGRLADQRRLVVRCAADALDIKDCPT